MALRIAVPARFASTRLPGKPLRLIAGEPLVVHTLRRALACGADEVVLATDHAGIAEAAAGLPVRVCMTPEGLATGSDRLAWCARTLGWSDDDLVVNLQGDEPLVPVPAIARVVATLAGDPAPVATLATPIHDAAEAFDANVVKVVRDQQGRALYFSRAVIPWHRDAFARDRDTLPADAGLLRHLGLYGYRAGFLRGFPDLPVSALEQAEALEQLRILAAGHAIAVAVVAERLPPGVDSEADIAAVEAALAPGADLRR
jgi:3-deoxy-manno-octulosonate cytidylyltransferase (CMP-KDO synthetase)